MTETGKKTTLQVLILANKEQIQNISNVMIKIPSENK